MPHQLNSHAGTKDHYRQLASDYNQLANKTCEQYYQLLARRYLVGRSRVIELGAGSSGLLKSIGSPLVVASDLSYDMLAHRSADDPAGRVIAAGERLPFSDGTFDGLVSINVLEHVADVEAVVAEAWRVLDDGGEWLAVTPNGNWEFWLDLAERWSLKLPEGPHKFLTTRELAAVVSKRFEVVEHKTFFVFPCGPVPFARALDRMTACSTWGWGFFQYQFARKRPAASL